jgi:phospholipid transport system substrate-binding protein
LPYAKRWHGFWTALFQRRRRFSGSPEIADTLGLIQSTQIGPLERKDQMDALNRMTASAMIFSMLLAGCWRDDATAGELQDKIRHTINEVIDILSDKTLKAPARTDERHAKMQRAVTQCFGFTEMAQRVMGPSWYTLTTAQRKEVVRLLGDLLEHAYVNRIKGSGATKENVQYVNERMDQDGYATVITEIVKPRAHHVVMAYHLLKRNQDWRIYDVTIDGMSLVRHYRTQFDKLIRQGSYESLVKQMKVNLMQEKAIGGVKG